MTQFDLGHWGQCWSSGPFAVCGDRGHVEFVALDAHRMWSEYSGT